ncbi:hypothetical protein DFP72DRAFT_1175259 [Ephemerocybe angulata]|uniref:Uncharacterized protein n=1 Tax=Ephemerocybe angulata TaxID=980116 RepID=A0A8H6HJN1_9AGAR|nr:hypothetical protein DFP72DRAFT_1175259 [Tulosesus angulatus]
MAVLLNHRFISMAMLLASTSISTAIPISKFQEVELVERGASSCYALTVDQAKTLPGWSKIEKYAQDTWGDGKVNIVTNPKEYPKSTADACIHATSLPVKWIDGGVKCSATKSTIQGQVDGTTQQVTFQQQTGTDQTGQWTVTSASELAENEEFTLGLDIPSDGIKAGLSESTTTTVTNTRSSSFTTVNKNLQTTTLAYENKSGQQCEMTLETQTCIGTAKGSAPVVATGMIWFNYTDKRAPKNDPKGPKHYKYAVDIASVLSEADRTSYIDFQGPVNSVSKTWYATGCKATGSGTRVGSKAARRSKRKASKKVERTGRKTETDEESST